MSKAQLFITAVVLEGRSKSEVARDYDVSRTWVQHLVRRYQTEGNAAFQPRSRRPHHNPRAMPIEVKDKIVRLRAVRFTGVNFEETILAWDEVHAGRSASTAHKHRF
jgi:transposase